MRIVQCSDLGVEVHEIAIQQCTTDQADRLVALVHSNKFVVIREQRFDEAEFVAFARRLGRPQVYLQSNYHHPNWPEIFVSSNQYGAEGRRLGVSGTGRYWHSDCAFLAEPLSLTMVSPRIIPQASRGTLYIDMQRVYERLPMRLRRFVDEHDAIHEGKWRYKVQASDAERAIIDILEELEQKAPSVAHPAVLEHPASGRRALYISRGFTTGFRGVPHEEGKRWLEELLAFVERREHVAEKPWRAGDVLLWDNRSLLHMAAHGDANQANLSYRIGVYDALPFYTKSSGSVKEAVHAAAD